MLLRVAACHAGCGRSRVHTTPSHAASKGAFPNFSCVAGRGSGAGSFFPTKTNKDLKSVNPTWQAPKYILPPRHAQTKNSGIRASSSNRCACRGGRGLGRMVLITDRGPPGSRLPGLPDVWASLKASAAANPDVPTVLLLVALDVDALSACAILMVRGLGPRAVPAAAYTRPPHTILPLARHRIRPSVLSDPCSRAPCSGCWKLSRSRTR